LAADVKGQAMKGNQKPMEEEELVESAATSKRVLIRSAEQSLEVERLSVIRHRTA
jgi:hypothetical protein